MDINLRGKTFVYSKNCALYFNLGHCVEKRAKKPLDGHQQRDRKYLHFNWFKIAQTVYQIISFKS